nr:Pentatricopeptide repeat [Ipomoea batatas]
MIFFQNQCFLHKKMVSSMGTPLVSGKNRQTNSVMAATHPAKKTKIPYLKAQRSERNDCPIAKITICTPPAMSKALRPHLSTVAMEMKVEAARTPPVNAEEYSEAFDPKPIVWNSTGAMFLKGLLIDFASSLASIMSCNSAPTFVVPRSFSSTCLPFSGDPRSTRLFGVSGRRIPPAVITSAGTAARPREILHPFGFIFSVP